MKYQVRCAGLPLAVYREVAAHLRQVEGVQTMLVTQQSQQFDYAQSQTDSLWIEYAENLPAVAQKRIQQILTHYSNRYGSWETLPAGS